MKGGKLNKLLALVLSFALVGTAAGCAGTSEDSENGSNGSTATSENTQASDAESDAGDDSEGIQVDEGLLTVDITFPASLYALADEEPTQEAVDAAVAEQGYLSGTLNSDGSATFTMTKLKQQELLDEVRRDFDTRFRESIADYPNVKSITRNDDFSEITIEVTEQDMASDILAFALTFTAYFYQVLDGKEFATDIVFVDASTGEELSRTSYPLED